MKTLSSFLIFLVAGAATAFAAAADPGTGTNGELRGMVTAVIDGDTVTLDVNGKEFKVRAMGIDAPELGQPYGREARQSLSSICLDRSASVRTVGWHGSGPVQGTLLCLGTDVANHQVNTGMAWVVPGEMAKDSTLFSNQNAARQLHIGLWKDAKPIAPWVWRKQGK